MRTRFASLLLLALLAPASAGAQGARWVSPRDSSTWLAGSGQLRWRTEGWSGFNAGMPAAADHDDVFGLSRLLLRGEARARGFAGAVVELKSSTGVSRSLAGGLRTADQDVLDVQQAYLEVTPRLPGARLALRAGRFDLALGRERLVSPLDWANTRRTFQGASVTAGRRAYAVIAFATRPVMIRRTQPNLPDSTRALYGVQVARAGAHGRVEAYWLRNESRTASVNGTAGYERRHTLGARALRSPAPRHFDADIEAAWQTGSIGTGTVNAWMLASQAGWTFGGTRATRVYAGLDLASGDAAAGGDVGTFSQLFPLGHAYLGYIDMHGRQNVADLSAGVSSRLSRRVIVQLDVHDFRRMHVTDAMYAVDGSVSRAAGTALPSHEGTEADATVRWSTPWSHLALQAGASAYVAGAFLKQSGPGSNVQWVYTQLTMAF